MKKVFFYLLMVVGSYLGLNILNGCSGGSICNRVYCGTNGQCDDVDGSCFCEQGYEIDINGRCNIKGTAKFIGTWKATENCGTNKSYIMIITPVTNDLGQITLFNFADKLCGNDSLTVTAQIIKTPNENYKKAINFKTICPDVVIDSLGTNLVVKGDTLVLNYKMNYNGQVYSCSANLLKL